MAVINTVIDLSHHNQFLDFQQIHKPRPPKGCDSRIRITLQTKAVLSPLACFGGPTISVQAAMGFIKLSSS